MTDNAADPRAKDAKRRFVNRGLWPLVFVGAGLGCTDVTTVDLLPLQAVAGASQRGYGGANATLGGASFVAGGTTGGTAGSAVSATAGATGGPRLVNRYDFSGTGTLVLDSVSNQNGEVMGSSALDDSGQLTLTGASTDFVRLPSWLLSSMRSVTIVTWFTWHGGPSWQSVFNFGYNADNTAAPSENVRAEFFFTPLMAPAPGASLHVDVVYGGAIDFVNTTDAFPVDRPASVAVVFDGELQQISLYIDGQMIGQPDPTFDHLSELKDANCWLGQSQWAHDVTNGGNFRGSYDEFRIYDGALTSEQIQRLSLTDPAAL